jgi:hypothetical protein
VRQNLANPRRKLFETQPRRQPVQRRQFVCSVSCRKALTSVKIIASPWRFSDVQTNSHPRRQTIQQQLLSLVERRMLAHPHLKVGPNRKGEIKNHSAFAGTFSGDYRASRNASKVGRTFTTREILPLCRHLMVGFVRSGDCQNSERSAGNPDFRVVEYHTTTLAARTTAKATAVLDRVPQLVRHHQQSIEESLILDLEELRPPSV